VANANVNNAAIATNNQAAGIPVSAKNLNTTEGLLYTVQIGVFKTPVTAADLKNLNPVYEEQVMGFIRYTTGIFSDPAKANVEKERIVQLGIPDAFVSAYYNGKKISLDEAARLQRDQGAKTNPEVGVTYPEKNVNTNTPANNAPALNPANIVFKVQIGSYKNQVPVNVVSQFLNLAANHGLDQLPDANGATVYAVGKFKTYNEAVQKRDILVNEGIKDAFIVAYDGTKKISVVDARKALGQ
jgi:hypothetical protein